ncbi:E3 ubiquitin-protein ligase RNF4-like isoform X2 [Achroia grisella]|uniref:E3 ubiquitin-protein ligase RNF4-like isoform X2 n=1 Tax=Achroia grisella TaxID=688607 RepID=UPI0027D22A86|nr:E3 ubiquitin-protein ligase RNF4-like isoform X2 [Achroia grisella]
MTSGDDFIDLTDSFTLVDHCALSNVVIDLDTDDSFVNSPVSREGKKRRHTTSKTSSTVKVKSISSNVSTKQDSESKKFSACPICWDELGNNPLASTKCGHVFCLKCLEQYLKIEKKCPTCRQVLKGANGYHPLYLNLN